MPEGILCNKQVVDTLRIELINTVAYILRVEPRFEFHYPRESETVFPDVMHMPLEYIDKHN